MIPLPALALALLLPLVGTAACVEEDPYTNLRRQVERLDHFFYSCCPLGEPIRCYASARCPDRRKVEIDMRIQHVNAQVILQEDRPERIQTEIDSIYRELCKIRVRDKRKRAAKARLWGIRPMISPCCKDEA